MTFPPEIRNKIYREVLVPALDDDNHGHVISLAQPGLTRTSRQIRNETLPIFYGQNHFTITVPPTSSRDWDVPRTDRVTRSLARRRAEYEERELPMPGGSHPDFLTWLHPKGWGQFLYTLDVMVRVVMLQETLISLHSHRPHRQNTHQRSPYKYPFQPCILHSRRNSQSVST